MFRNVALLPVLGKVGRVSGFDVTSLRNNTPIPALCSRVWIASGNAFRVIILRIPTAVQNISKHFATKYTRARTLRRTTIKDDAPVKAFPVRVLACGFCAAAAISIFNACHIFGLSPQFVQTYFYATGARSSCKTFGTNSKHVI